jgi:hypothetical protein
MAIIICLLYIDNNLISLDCQEERVKGELAAALQRCVTVVPTASTASNRPAASFTNRGKVGRIRRSREREEINAYGAEHENHSR